ncbi:LysR family transcriptional regulator [Vibrio maritimus]|uniref:LysR family transcriptional regulator n=1 Tax=Vibrio maritimus TaxID=990268 RepID=UPI0037362F13
MKRNNLDDFYIFHSVAKHESISIASESLGLSIATVSRRLVALEQELKVKLFNRTGRSLTLTNEGRLYSSRLYDLLEKLDDEIELLRYVNSNPIGHLRLSMPSFIYEYVLFDVISKFQETYPKIKLSVSTIYNRNSDLADDADITFRVHEPTSPDLICRNLLSLEQSLISSQKNEQELAKFSDLKHWLDQRELVSYADNLEISVCEEDGINWYTYHSNNQSLLLSNATMVIKSLSKANTYTLMPKLIVYSELVNGDLYEVAPNWKKSTLPINMIYRSRVNLPSHQRLFIDAINDHFDGSKPIM